MCAPFRSEVETVAGKACLKGLKCSVGMQRRTHQLLLPKYRTQSSTSWSVIRRTLMSETQHESLGVPVGRFSSLLTETETSYDSHFRTNLESEVKFGIYPTIM